jgi:hypothetical protein
MLKKVRDLFRPARNEAAFKGEGLVVADLDKMVVQPLAFRYGDRVHFIKPVDVQNFLIVTERIAVLDRMQKAKELSGAELVRAYADLIASMCDTIKIDDVRKMSQAQVGALYQLILDAVTGRAYAEKKSLPRTQLRESETGPTEP